MLKTICASYRASGSCNEVIILSFTASATIEAVIDEGFTLVFVDVNKDL